LQGKNGSFRIIFSQNGANEDFNNAVLNVQLDNIELVEVNSNLTALVITSTATNLYPGEVAWLSATGCETGTIRWSNNEVGNTIAITANKEGIYSAVCEKDGFESPKSNEILIVKVGSNSIGNAESFFDIDPGYGNGNQINISGSDVVNNIPIPINNLTQGVHSVSIRVKGQNDKWSLTHTKTFLVIGSSSSGTNSIADVEYFIDSLKQDRSNLISTGISSANDATINLPLAQNVSEGVHSVTVRVKDNQGKYSLFHTKTYLVLGTSSGGQNAISQVQYFYDQDPGEANRITQAISLDANNKALIPLNITLPLGVHSVSFRVKDTQGKWSLFHTKVFLVMGNGAANASLSKVEYYLDTDPGFGNGTQINYTAMPGETQWLNIALNNLSTGVHVLYVRVKNSAGVWSLTHGKVFLIMPNTSSNKNITRIEYFLDDNDPGLGNANNVAFVTNNEGGVTASFNLNVSSLTTGIHRIHARVKDSENYWSPVSMKGFNIIAPLPPICSAQNGAWDNPSTWTQNRVPHPNENIEIMAGHTVTVPSGTYQVKGLKVNGILNFTTGGVLLITGE
jgi:hypothetical protein